MDGVELPIVRGWLDGWRSRKFALDSPLPAQEARARLQAALSSRWRSGEADGRWVVGDVGRAGSFRLAVRNTRWRHAWRPVAECDLYARATGSGLIGTLRSPAPALVVSAIWLGFAGLLFLFDLLFTVVPLVAGRLPDTGAAAQRLGLSAAFVVFGLGLTGVGFAVARKDQEFLLDELRRELRA